jgi:hypothetical protein
MLTVNEQNSQDLCIKSCMECFEQLTRAIHYCLEKRYLNGEHLKLFFEAIDLCRVSSTLLLSHSDLSFEHAQITAKVCDECARNCFSYHDDFLHSVGGFCLETARACRQLAH